MKAVNIDPKKIDHFTGKMPDLLPRHNKADTLQELLQIQLGILLEKYGYQRSSNMTLSEFFEQRIAQGTELTKQFISDINQAADYVYAIHAEYKADRWQPGYPVTRMGVPKEEIANTIRDVGEFILI